MIVLKADQTHTIFNVANKNWKNGERKPFNRNKSKLEVSNGEKYKLWMNFCSNEQVFMHNHKINSKFSFIALSCF